MLDSWIIEEIKQKKQKKQESTLIPLYIEEYYPQEDLPQKDDNKTEQRVIIIQL